VDSDELASMYAQIVNGVPKEQSRFVTDEESSAAWEQIAAEVEQMRADNPNVIFDVPNELPSRDGDDDPAWTGRPRGGTATPTATESDTESAGAPPPGEQSTSDEGEDSEGE
jgi:hypothetical protein